MTNDYVEEGFGSVLDYFEIIKSSEVFAWICFVKLDTGNYGVTRLENYENASFEFPAFSTSSYQAATIYWNGIKDAKNKSS